MRPSKILVGTMKYKAAAWGQTSEHIPALFTLQMSFVEGGWPFNRLVCINGKESFASCDF